MIVYPAVVELREAAFLRPLSGGSALERRTPHVTPNVSVSSTTQPSDGFIVSPGRRPRAWDG